MHVCVVIVTYANRYYFVKEVVAELLKQDIDKIIIVDNNSDKKSKENLEKLRQKFRYKINILWNSKNTGSAGGYKRGLEEAYKCAECEFIWLLDDDNKPLKEALEILKNFWKNLKIEDKERRVALLSFRKDREIYKKAVIKNKPDLLLNKKNSFLGIHIIDLPLKIIERFFFKKANFSNTEKEWGIVSVAPYGGLFFHKKLLEKIGYPDERYFTYVDDHEFTYRITRNGGKIILVMDSVIEDLEMSWQKKNSKKFFYTPLIDTEDNKRIYLFVRNRINFEKNFLVTDHRIYKLNRHVFFCIIRFLAIFKRGGLQKLNIIKKAIKDGLRDDFSYSPYYE